MLKKERELRRAVVAIKNLQKVFWKEEFSWLGSYGECDTHDPIPNSIVKPFSADDTSAQAGGKVGRYQAY